jgi:putative aldouronate transport system substrate-binding protein
MRRFQYLLVFVLLAVPLVQLSAAPAGEAAAAEEEVITIEWAGRDDAGEPVHEDNYVGQRLAERFPDVQFIINHADIEPKEKLLVMAASGELPEFGFIAKIHALAFDFYSDGITRSIPWDMVRERAPNLTKFLDEDPIGWITRQVPGEEAFFALASLKKYKGGLGNVPTLRYDWLETIGMEPPNAKDVEPEDPGRWFWAPYQYEYDDVVKILTAFRDQDLDGNGKDDTIPLLLSQKPSDFLSWTGMFGLTYYMDNVEVDGQTTFNVITEDWKDFLKMMRSWYEEGFINRDFATMTGQKSTDIKMMANFGLYSDAWPKMFKADLPGRWQTVTQANFPQQKLLVTDPFIGPTGKTGSAGESTASSWAWNTIVREDVSDAKLARFLEVYDYLNCTVEGHILTRNGEPGVHFDWHGEPYNSYAQRRDGVRPEGGEEGLRFYSSYFQPREWNVFLDNPDLAEVATYYRDTVGPDKYLILPSREDLFKETAYLNVRAKYGAALETMVIEFWFKAMIGSVDIDAEWDSYVQDWLKAGGSELIEEISKAPITSELRKGNRVY